MTMDSNRAAGSGAASPSMLHFQQILDATAQLAQQDLAPAAFHEEFLRRLLAGLAAPAAAIWGRPVPGSIPVLCEINLQATGIDRSETDRETHDRLLQHVFQTGRPVVLPPLSSGNTPDGSAGLTNPTDLVVLLAPVIVDREVVGVIEVWQDARCHPDVLALGMQFFAAMAQLASGWTRNYQVRQLAAQQQLWQQIESFSCRVHGSLNLSAVAYRVANDGRRLIDCDRLSVAVRRGRRTVIEAISGVDALEKRSRLVVRMQRLCERVLQSGGRLVYQGNRDDTLPVPVLDALDEYLAESTCKLLVVLPLEREPSRGKARPRSALVMECFQPAVPAEQLQGRLEVIGRHAATALENAATYRRVPLRWLWQSAARITETAGRRLGIALGLAIVLALIAILVWVPSPLKLEGHGQLLPQERCLVYSPVEGQVVRFEPGVRPGSPVAENQALVLMYDVQLELKLTQLASEIAAAQDDIASLARQQNSAGNEADRARFAAEKRQREFVRNRKMRQLQALRERLHADETRPGYFWLHSPIRGTVLTWDFRENLINRSVKPSEPLLRIGDKDRGWEVELKIPHKYIGRVVRAFERGNPEAELDVDLLAVSSPTRTFKGKLSRHRLGGEALPPSVEQGVAEPVVLASVRIAGDDIPEEFRIPPELLVTGTEIHARINCGPRPLGYSWFHGLWEFWCEKVVFPWF